jgi:hypothetical protein
MRAAAGVLLAVRLQLAVSFYLSAQWAMGAPGGGGRGRV